MEELHDKGWLPEETQAPVDAFAAGRSEAEIDDFTTPMSPS
jgi:hypothetical protein